MRMTLDNAAERQPLAVAGIELAPTSGHASASGSASASVSASGHAPAAWTAWLEDIGFTPGEEVMLMRRDIVGGGAVVVRIGSSTFALRRAEAACILVRPLDAAVPA